MTEISDLPPRQIASPVMIQDWNTLTFLHWSYPPAAIRPLLPRSLELDTFNGLAWIGLTPFLLSGLHPPGLPALPWISQFPEMNVRTYVRGPDGESGIWFFSLEAARLAAVISARLSYSLPYRWARMRVSVHSGCVEYSSRRWLGRGSAQIRIEVGAAIDPGPKERFLTARFRLYTKLAGRLAFAQVDHPPWPLHSAVVLNLSQDVISYSGVPAPFGDPFVLFSPGVRTRIGAPQFSRSANPRTV
jgi:uncharacterized protein YqjF (DUF2071 family)